MHCKRNTPVLLLVHVPAMCCLPHECPCECSAGHRPCAVLLAVLQQQERAGQDSIGQPRIDASGTAGPG